MRFEVCKVEEIVKLIEKKTSGTLDKVSDKLRKQVEELIFQGYCCECNRMAAIPQGAFAVLQVRKNLERPYPSAKFYENDKDTKDNKTNNGFNAKVLQEGRELTPLKYNSKLMNSIWGLYNRYSVHNFKKIDANDSGILAYWGFDYPNEATAKVPCITAGH